MLFNVECEMREPFRDQSQAQLLNCSGLAVNSACHLNRAASRASKTDLMCYMLTGHLLAAMLSRSFFLQRQEGGGARRFMKRGRAIAISK